MGLLRCLPESTINRIAAGEVVERPSAALKELLENAIDAGASRLEIVMEAGGRNRLMVTDDGHGIAREDLPLAVTRHATSKLPDDDLWDIRFLGFRGEALASIASISRLRVTSRTLDAPHGWSLSVEAGVMGDVSPAPHPVGTTVEVRDLFFATPARLRFLRSEAVEQDQMMGTMTALALLHPEIEWVIRHEKRQHHWPAGTLEFRIKTVLGDNFLRHSVPCGWDEPGVVRVDAWIGVPTYHRRLADQQWFFVNGRLIRDRLLQHAVRSAYQDVMVHGRHAVGVWRCELPPSMVDVNVHPTKAEVRFADPSAVRRVMIRAISDGLARIRQQTREPVFSVATLQEASSSQVAPLQLLNPLKEAVNAEFPRAMAESRAWLRPQRSESAVPWLASDRGRTGSEGGRGVPLAEVLPPPSLTQAEADFQTDAQPEIQTVLDTAWVSQPLGEARAQLRETYIVSESKEGLVLVDQHAAHERLVYEAMKEEMRLEGLPRQRLLLPELVTLQEREKDALCRHAGDLKKAGLVLESAEGNGVLVREMPSWLALDSLAGLLQDLAAEWLDEVEPMALEEAFEHMLETLACHRSIRAGRRLRLEEMDRLLRDMETTPNSGQCNHGRPTSILLSWEAIERLFGRR